MLGAKEKGARGEGRSAGELLRCSQQLPGGRYRNRRALCQLKNAGSGRPRPVPRKAFRNASSAFPFAPSAPCHPTGAHHRPLHSPSDSDSAAYACGLGTCTPPRRCHTDMQRSRWGCGPARKIVRLLICHAAAPPRADEDTPVAASIALWRRASVVEFRLWPRGCDDPVLRGLAVSPQAACQMTLGVRSSLVAGLATVTVMISNVCSRLPLAA